MNPCDHCPLVDRSRPCLAVESGSRRLCDLAGTDPHYRDFLADWQGEAEQQRRTAAARRAAKPRGSLNDAIAATKPPPDCVPCRERNVR